jgi:hypothetical protein
VIAPVTEASAGGDRAWFSANPTRRYRARPGWIIRRRGTALLRTRAAARSLPDDDTALRVAWVGAAWPDLDPVQQRALIKAIRTTEPQR